MVNGPKFDKYQKTVLFWKRAGIALLVAIFLGIVGIIIATSFTADSVRSGNPSGCDKKRYGVPFVCGVNPGAFPRVNPGRYSTLVHVHNHQSHTIDLEKKISLDFPPAEQAPGFVSDPIAEELKSCHTIMIDCQEILGDFNITGQMPPYFAGLVSVTVDEDDEATVWGEQTILSLANPATNAPTISVYNVPGKCAKSSAGALKPTLWMISVLLFFYLMG